MVWIPCTRISRQLDAVSWNTNIHTQVELKLRYVLMVGQNPMNEDSITGVYCPVRVTLTEIHRPYLDLYVSSRFRPRTTGKFSDFLV